MPKPFSLPLALQHALIDTVETNPHEFTVSYIAEDTISARLSEWFPRLDDSAIAKVTESIVQCADRDTDGLVSLAEFAAFMNDLTTNGITSEAAAEEAGQVDEQTAFYEVIMKNLGADEVDMLRDAFIHMDMDSDGFVSMDEMLSVVHHVVGDEKFPPLADYLKPIFIVADKDRDGKLNLTEFLLSFAEGPGVVPTEVINACVSSIRVRLTDEEIYALQERFRKIDTNNDGFIDQQELLVGLREALATKLPEPSDAVFKQILNVVMAMADTDHAGKLSLAEFIRSFQEDQGVLPAAFIDTRAQNAPRRLTPEETKVILDAFSVIDTNHDGYITYDELYKIIWDAISVNVPDSERTRDLCDLIMASADRNADGKLSLSEFVNNFQRHAEIMSIPLVAAAERVAVVKQRLTDILESDEFEVLARAFTSLDRNGDQHIDAAEFSHALNPVLRQHFPHKSEEFVDNLLQLLFSCADIDQDNKISIREFVSSFAIGDAKADKTTHEMTAQAAVAPADDHPGQDPAANEAALAMPQPLVSAPSHRPPPTTAYDGSPVHNDASQCAITDAQLRREFDKYDKSQDGTLNREEFKRIYMTFEHFGIEPTQSEVNAIFNKYSNGKPTISFDEFCILILQRSKM